MQCPRCSAEVSPEAEFCSACDFFFGASDETALLSDRSGDEGEAVSPIVDETMIEAEAQPSSTGGWSRPIKEQAVAPVTGTLKVGGNLGERYEILQMLGKGGMGAVYKARDTELDRLVAVKVIKPELAQDPEVLQRFKQEILLSSQVTHRNVIRIFDLGQADDIKFISMEFVEGQDLHGVLKERGSLPPEEAVEIMEQVCLALTEAHEAGVVHRDLKPHNIMIEEEGRVVVMDFGIARSVQITGVTQTGSVLGTPDYMSPEQVKGQTVDARADIFALGVILFRLLAGQVPFKGDSPMASMYMRTQDRARSVREVNPEVPGFLGDVIARCLEISPQRRYQSARELLQDLEIWRGGTSRTLSHTMRHLRPAAPTPRKRLAVLGGAALLVLAIILAVVFPRPQAGPGKPDVAAASRDTISLAILPFRNATGAQDLEWLSTGLAEMLSTDVGESAHLRTVSADRLHQVLKDLRVSANANLDGTTRRRVAEFSNAETLVWGQFVKLGERIRIDATVEDIGSQQSVAVKVEAASSDELLEAIEELAGLVRENLALSTDRVEELQAESFRPSSDSVAALRYFTQGLELLRQGNNLEAVDHFKRSVDEDPGFALAHSRLGESLHLTGRGDEAIDTSRRALQLSEGLPPRERYSIVATDARINNDLDRGVEAYQRLLERRPDDPDLNYELGKLYEEEGLFDRAQEHFAKTLVADPQNLSALLASGQSLSMKGDAEGALEPLNRALSLAVQLDNQEVESQALQSLGEAFQGLNRLDEALQRYEQSLAIHRELGDQHGEAKNLNSIAYVQDLSGEYGAARESYERTIELRRELGDQRGVSIGMMNIGDMERIRGNYEESLRLTREALQIQIDLDDEFNQGLSLNNIGATYYLLGKYDDALVYYQRALEIREHLEVPGEIADTLHNLGETYATVGRFDRALDHYLRALELRRSGNDQRGAALESYYMGKVFAAQGRYGAALSSISEASEILRQLEDRSFWLGETLGWHGYLLEPPRQSRGSPRRCLDASRAAGDWSWRTTGCRSQTLQLQGERAYYMAETLQGARSIQQEALQSGRTDRRPSARFDAQG